MRKKGQLTLEGAPAVVMIVGLVFLVMATMALIAEKYNDSFPADNSATITNEAATRTSVISTTGYRTAGANQENAQDFVLIGVLNGTGGVKIGNGNFSLNSATGVLTNVSSLQAYISTTSYPTNYSFSFSGVAANVTTDLTTEIANNTSIAGIILTISLVGIVLSILVGVFVSIRNRRV